MVEHQTFKKIPRLSRDIVITEKLDGTNAQITITEDGQFLIGSRNRWITPENDNHGFARWATQNKEELMKLGVGTHYGEWWGTGIARGYYLSEKRFSLFNVAKWQDPEVRPKCCHVVPVLYQGPFDTAVIDRELGNLKSNGSVAAKGFMKPEGIIIFHTAGNLYFKKTCVDDEFHKGELKGE